MTESLFGNTLFYGDNLTIMRQHIADESVDLIYLDPPFNSQKSYNILFKTASTPSTAQAHAFDDTWHWGPEAERTYHGLIHGDSAETAEMALALRSLIGECDMLAYLVMMAPRLLEMKRVLKPTGSICLHCDPTASHYLKLLMDAIFGPTNFRNEVVWKRTTSKSLMTRRLANNHDVLLWYQSGTDAYFNLKAAFAPYDEDDLDEKTAAKYCHRDPDGRRYQLTDLTNPNPNRPNLVYEFLGVTKVWRWKRARMLEAYRAGRVVQSAPGRVPRYKRYLDEQRGKPLGDVWTDIFPLNSQAAERLGYPTQKPLGLLERLITLGSRPGDVVLDPFCGCGTTVDAAHRLDRRWIGIDISCLAIDVIDTRMRATYGDGVAATYEVKGIPVDIEGATALAARDKFEFERWAVSLLDATPNAKQVGDRGVDGVARFAVSAKTYGKILISVKGGANNPGFVRDLAGTVDSHRAAMGIMISLHKVTKGMQEAAASAGVYVHPTTGQVFPKVQVVTVEELLSGKRPARPATLMPYVSADKLVEEKSVASAPATVPDQQPGQHDSSTKSA